MTTAQLIARLKELDPSGEMEVVHQTPNRVLCHIFPQQIKAFSDSQNSFYSESEERNMSFSAKQQLKKQEVISL